MEAVEEEEEWFHRERPKTVPQEQGRWPHPEVQRPRVLVCRPSLFKKVPSRSMESDVMGPVGL